MSWLDLLIPTAVLGAMYLLIRWHESRELLNDLLADVNREDS